MRLLEIYLGGALGLVALYLVMANPGASGQVIRSLAELNTDSIRVLQGR